MRSEARQATFKLFLLHDLVTRLFCPNVPQQTHTHTHTHYTVPQHTHFLQPCPYSPAVTFAHCPRRNRRAGRRIRLKSLLRNKSSNSVCPSVQSSSLMILHLGLHHSLASVSAVKRHGGTQSVQERRDLLDLRWWRSWWRFSTDSEWSCWLAKHLLKLQRALHRHKHKSNYQVVINKVQLVQIKSSRVSVTQTR